MPQLFVARQGAPWLIAPLSGDSFVLSPDANTPVRTNRGPIDGHNGLYVLRAGTGSAPCWVLLNMQSALRFRVNGERPLFDLHVLRHQDEISLEESTRMYFSTERLPRVEPYPGVKESAHCPRCRQLIDPGAPSVQCPGCDVWHHQFDNELPCWTYAETCSLCDHPTPLNDAFRWVPEGI